MCRAAYGQASEAVEFFRNLLPFVRTSNGYAGELSAPPSTVQSPEAFWAKLKFALIALIFCFAVFLPLNGWAKQPANATSEKNDVYFEIVAPSKPFTASLRLSEQFLQIDHCLEKTNLKIGKSLLGEPLFLLRPETPPFPVNKSLFCDQPSDIRQASFKDNSTRAFHRFSDRCVSDFKNMYSRDSLCNFGFALMGGAVLANTKMDRNFTSWYQKHVRCDFTDDFSEFSKIFGEGKIFIPVAVASTVVYRLWQENTGKTDQRRGIGDFFSRTARGYAAGTPTLLICQYVLGSDRPRNGSSYWKPFQNNHGVSGHSYIGAIPFLTAAEMSDRLFVKGIFYTLSIIPGWSRVNDNAHYLSQSVLGWYLAYLSVRAVSATEGTKPWVKGLTIFPVTETNAVGIGFHLRY